MYVWYNDVIFLVFCDDSYFAASLNVIAFSDYKFRMENDFIFVIAVEKVF